MYSDCFSKLEIDAIGEILNISLGASATAVSTMLNSRVDITTPVVNVVRKEEFEMDRVEPAVCVEITYVEGLEGENVMLLKRHDIKVIVELVMGMEIPDEDFELDEINISAVCEVMNQMMGASATALSEFLGRMVNISTPESFELTDLDKVKEEHFPVTKGPVVVVRFNLTIDDVLDSEFMNVMSVELGKELIAGFGLDLSGEEAPAPVPAPAAPAPSGGGATMSQEEIEALMAGGSPAAAPAPAPAPSAPATPAAPAAAPVPPPGMPPAGEMPVYPGYPPYGQMPAPGQYPYPYPPYPMYPPQQPPDPKVINAQPAQMKELSGAAQLNQEQKDNLDLILSVSLEVAVEIGRTRRKIQDILSFSKGSLVVLDKLAGDQVDLLVNGQCVAKGDVVVIDDNFGIRITEILQKPDINVLTQG